MEKTLKSTLDYKEIKQVNPKGNQAWIFTRRADAEAPICWPHDAKNRSIRKDTEAGKDWRLKEGEVTEDEMVGWHHRLNWDESEQGQEDSEGQGRLACCGPWGRKESDMKGLNNNSRSLILCSLDPLRIDSPLHKPKLSPLWGPGS